MLDTRAESAALNANQSDQIDYQSNNLSGSSGDQNLNEGIGDLDDEIPF